MPESKLAIGTLSRLLQCYACLPDDVMGVCLRRVGREEH